jgi:hypothetical protein
MNSTKGLGVNTECIPTSFLQRRPGRLYIYSVKKHSGVAIKDTYLGYMIEITQQAHGGWHMQILQQYDNRISPRDRVLLG